MKPQKLVMPSDTDAEMVVLGSILVDSNLLHTAKTIVEAADFYYPQHQRLYRAMCEIDSGVIDSITLREEIGDAEFDKIGGEDKLVELSSLWCGTESFGAHCKVVLEYSIRRQLIRIFSVGQSECFEGVKSSPEIIQDVAASVIALNKTREPVKKLRDLLSQAVDLFEQGYERPAGQTNFSTSVPTGIESLDCELTGGGIARGLMCTIAAESSKGKSALGVTLAKMAARHKQKILVATYEDSPLSVAIRLISQESGIENRVLQGCHLRREHFDKISPAIGSLWDCHIDFIVPKKIDQTCAEMMAENMRTGYDMFLFDYLQNIPPGVRTNSNQERVDYVFSAALELARQSPNTATVMISQLARIKGRRPQITDLYHSGQIEQGSRTIMMIWHPDVFKEENAAVIDIAKQHNGPQRSVIVGFRKPNVLFHALPEGRASQLEPKLFEAIKEDRRKHG